MQAANTIQARYYTTHSNVAGVYVCVCVCVYIYIYNFVGVLFNYAVKW